MRIFSWLFFVLVVGLVGLLAYKVRHGTQGDPDLLVAQAQQLAGGADQDLGAAIDKLGFALRIAQGDPLANHDRIGGILAVRGGIFAGMGQYAQARIDLERVLKDYRPDDPDVQLDLAAVLLATDEAESALALTQSVLARDPRRADGWTLQARALVGLADGLLGEAADICEDSLADREEVRAAELVDRITSLEADSLHRVDYLYQLRELFGSRYEGSLRDVIRLAEQASEYVTEARTALAESFRESPTPDSVEEFAGLLRRAGRRDLAIDFGLAAVNRSFAGRDIDFLQTLLEDLLAEERAHTGVDMVNQYLVRSVLPGREFYSAWMRALYEDEKWDALVFVAGSMRNSTSDDNERNVADLYLGLAHERSAQYFEAPSALLKFTTSGALDPFPGARVEAYLALAHCYRELDQPDQEKAALRGALQDAQRGQDGVADAWLRLADLIRMHEPQSSQESFEALTQAICHAPSRLEELLPRWRANGEAALAKARIDLDLVIDSLNRSGLLVPEGRVEPYELVLLAERYHKAGNTGGVAGCARKFLLRFPGFPPMLDLYIESARRMSDPDLLARLLFERLEQLGPDAATLDELLHLPAHLITRERRMRLIEMDPERTGRLAVVRDLQSRGRALEALAGLNLVPLEELDDEGRLLQARLAHELGRWGLAEQALEPIRPDSPQYGPALELRLDLTVASSRKKALEELIAEVTARPAPDVDFLLETADHMLLEGQAASARLLLERLDQRPETRSGRVMFRLATTEWSLGQQEQAFDDLARAQAYVTDGSPELGWIVQAVDQRRWKDLPWLVSDLQTTAFSPTLLQAAILDILREEPREARALVERGRREAPEDARWVVVDRALELVLSPRTGAGSSGADEGSDLDLDYLLTGLGGGDRDPRRLLARLLAMDHPAWLVWATSEFEREETGVQGGIWATYLAALCRERHGDLERAELHARTILEEWKDFVPAWDLLERVTLAGVPRPDHPRFVRVQLSRLRNLGDPTEVEPLDLLVFARAQIENGNLDDAIVHLERALELDPDYLEALVALAQVQRDRLEWRPAIGAYARAIAVGGADERVLPELLAVLEQAAELPELRPLVQEQVESLAVRFPEDPRVTLARARRELEHGVAVPEVRLGRAYARLDDFRTATGYRRLEDLAPGSTEAWLDFLLEHDPKRGHQLIEQELASAPESVDLWFMLGRTLSALGRRSDAIETLTFVLRMLPDARATRALAHLLSESGKDTEQVQFYASKTMQLERIRSRDTDLRLAVARSLVNNLSASARGRGIAELQELWTKDSLADDQAQRVQIGTLYGLALTWRSDAKDRRTAHDVLMEVEPLVPDPVERHMIRAAANLALTMSQ